MHHFTEHLDEDAQRTFEKLNGAYGEVQDKLIIAGYYRNILQGDYMTLYENDTELFYSLLYSI